MEFECNICCETIKPNKKLTKIECIKCKYTVCSKCQKTYNNGDCMNCHMTFTNKFLMEHLGKTFIEKSLKPKIIEELMVDQKKNLSNVQPLVDYEIKYKEMKDKLRFGITLPIPIRPDPNNLESNNFRCPIIDCRGFVNKGLCGICKTKICNTCREKMNTDHVCDKNILENLKAIGNDSKQCPKCDAFISKTHGCNHMQCTNCKTHFEWITLKILTNSSNQHYAHLNAFSQNISVKSNSNDNCQNFSLVENKIPVDLLKDRKINPIIVHSLYNISNTIRLLKRKKYNEEEYYVENNQILQQLQVKFLLKTITEKQWESKVYSQHKKKQLMDLQCNIFNIYLNTIDFLQSELYNQTMNEEEIYKNIFDLVNLCNSSFQSIYEEYGGILIIIKNITDNDDVEDIKL